MVEERVEQTRQRSDLCPQLDLIVHPGASERHAMHDPIHGVDHQAHGTGTGMRHEFLHAPEVRGAAQVLLVDGLDGGEAFVSPEPLPRGRLTVRAVNAGGEVQRWAARETGLSGHHGQRGDPGEQALLPEPQRRPLLREQVVNHHPLVERQPVHHDECDLPVPGFLPTPPEQPGNLVNHHRWRRWQIVQRFEALPDPGGKRLVDPIADAAVPFQSGPVERTPVGAEDERVHLRPAWCESKPHLV